MINAILSRADNPGHVVLTVDDARAILGPNRPDPMPAGLLPMPSLADALTHLTDTIERRALDPDTADTEPLTVLVLDHPPTDPHTADQLAELLHQGGHLGVAALIHGTWPPGDEITITGETITHTHGPAVEHLHGARAYNQPEDSALHFLTLIAHAHTTNPPDQPNPDPDTDPDTGDYTTYLHPKPAETTHTTKATEHSAEHTAENTIEHTAEAAGAAAEANEVSESLVTERPGTPTQPAGQPASEDPAVPASSEPTTPAPPEPPSGLSGPSGPPPQPSTGPPPEPHPPTAHGGTGLAQPAPAAASHRLPNPLTPDNLPANLPPNIQATLDRIRAGEQLSDVERALSGLDDIDTTAFTPSPPATPPAQAHTPPAATTQPTVATTTPRPAPKPTPTPAPAGTDDPDQPATQPDPTPPRESQTSETGAQRHASAPTGTAEGQTPATSQAPAQAPTEPNTAGGDTGIDTGAPTVPMKPVLDLELLDTTRLTWPGTPTNGDQPPAPDVITPSDTPTQLLCFLALHPNGITRSAIIAALWPDATAENVLSMNLKRLNEHIATRTDGAITKVVRTPRGKCELDRNLIDVDYWRLLDALDLPLTTSPTDRADAYLTALTAYQGQLAADIDALWMETYRESVNNKIVAAGLRLAQELATDNHHQHALALLYKVKTYNPLHQPTYYSIIGIHQKLNQPDQANQTYNELKEKLAEFGLKPQRQPPKSW